MKMILAATRKNEEIYFITDPNSPNDGVSVLNGIVKYVPFWSYVYRDPVEQLQTNQFLKDLWAKSSSSEKLTDQYINRTEALPTDLLESIKSLLLDVPPETSVKPASDFMGLGTPRKPIKTENQVREDPKKPNKKEEEISDIQTKGRMRLPSFGKPARAARSVNAMFDGDLDGRVGDGTPEERPAPPVRIIKDIMNHIMVRNPGDTKKALTDRKGNWNPERVQLHNAISTMFRRRGTKSEDPTVFLLGGGPASRKSSALNAGLPRMPKDGEAVNADADQIKELIPEYKSWKKTDKHAASHVHQESKHIHSVVTDDLLEDQSDVIYDTTGDGNYGDFKKRVGGLRKNGHKIVAHYMTNDIELAKELNYKRYKETGRKVPTHQLEYIHGQVSRVVPQALKDDLFDEFYLYDTNNLTKPPRLIASKKRGEPLKVQDKYAFKRFLKKGVPPKPPKSSKPAESSGKFKLPGFSGKPKAPTLPIGDFGGKKPKR
jgi:hypothetical protein